MEDRVAKFAKVRQLIDRVEFASAATAPTPQAAPEQLRLPMGTSLNQTSPLSLAVGFCVLAIGEATSRRFSAHSPASDTI